MKNPFKKTKKLDLITKIIIGAISIVLLSIGGGLIWASTLRLPDISTFEARKIANSSKITDRTGEVVLYDIHQSVRRTEIPLNEMGENIIEAVLSIEDTHFYNHKGIRPTSIIRASLNSLKTMSFSQGGSTITQQIVKNTLLTTDKKITRKLKEWILAVRLERHFEKDQILQIYLNDAPFGSTIYGVEEASQAFFSKQTKELTIAESAYLAAMLPAPSYYSPFGNNKDRLHNRKDLVLKKMLEYERISEEEYEIAKNEEVVFNQSASNSIKAPHFVFYILDYLQKKYGEDVMESGGYTIKTTLDYELQQEAERIITEQAPKNMSQYRASNTALFATDPKTGQILSMVGSRNYFDKEIDGAYNVVTAQRQPGSAFKPFVYLTAFEKGYTPETIIFDVPTEFSTNCNPDMTPKSGYTEKDCYHPSNFDNKFRGPISIRSALAESRNIPSVKLLYLVSVEDAVKNAHKLGITTLKDPKSLGLSLVLGGGEVSLFDMTTAYATIANSGTRNITTGILEVKNKKGDVIEKFEENSVEAIDKNTTLILNDVLSDAQARVPTFGFSSITIPGVAVKTGTTNDNKDAWIIGYTPDIAVGVWSGNNDNKSMASGGSAISGPIWKEFMNKAIAKIGQTDFEKPIIEEDESSLKPVLKGEWMGNETVKIDSITGLRATDKTPAEVIIEKVITDVKDILFWVDKKDPRGPAPRNPSSDPQFNSWNYAVQRWWQQHAQDYNAVALTDLPEEYETLHQGDAGELKINGLDNSIPLNEMTTISISTDGDHPLNSVDIYINNSLITNLPAAPFRFNFIPKDFNYKTGKYTLKFIGTNSIFAKSTIEKEIEIVN